MSHRQATKDDSPEVAVFTSDVFDRPGETEMPFDKQNFNEQYPWKGREFALALQAAFDEDGSPSLVHAVDEEQEPCWEHGEWLLRLKHDGKHYTVGLWPLPTETPHWRLRVSEDLGCLMMLLGLPQMLIGRHRPPEAIPESAKDRLQAIVEKVAKTSDFRWTTEKAARSAGHRASQRRCLPMSTCGRWMSSNWAISSWSRVRLPSSTRSRDG
jgi:hypothetical protein